MDKNENYYFVFLSAPKGAEHLQVQYSGQKVDGHGERDFEKAFVQAASSQAGISE